MKAISFFYYLFAIVGLCLLGGSFYHYQERQAFLEKAESTQGTVIELIPTKSKNSTSYYSLVEFTTKTGEKIRFSSSISTNPPTYDVGENVEVLYDPLDPKRADINGFFSLYLMPLIFGILGTISSLIGFLNIFFANQKRKKQQALLDNGKRISTKFESVQFNSNFKSNGRRPYQIYSQWLDPNTNEVYVFKSENVWFDPTDHIKSEEIRVTIDPNDPKRYVMDTSFLPNLKN